MRWFLFTRQQCVRWGAGGMGCERHGPRASGPSPRLPGADPILARDQEALAKRFACDDAEDRRFLGLDCETGETGAPLLTGSVASLDCRLEVAHEAGDHIIYVGEVVGLHLSDGDPLLFYNRGYCGLAE